MKKVIRLTEQDLVRIVRRVINEADTKVDGCVKGDCKNGYGERNYSWGSYKGHFKNEELDGYGVLKLKTGGTYKGKFINDGYGGYGTFTNKQGRVFTGLWQWVVNGLYYRKPNETQNKQYGAKFHYDLENIKKDQSVDTKKCKKPDVDYEANWFSASFDKNYEYTHNSFAPLEKENTTGNCWWAKNIKNGKLFNLTDLAKTNPKVQKSIDILNKEHLNKYSGI